MKNSIKKGLFLPTLLAASALLTTACSDWTDYESLEIKTPTMDEGLRADYEANLKAYKAGEHKIVMTTFENAAGGRRVRPSASWCCPTASTSSP